MSSGVALRSGVVHAAVSRFGRRLQGHAHPTLPGSDRPGRRRLAGGLTLGLLAVSACGGSGEAATETSAPPDRAETTATTPAPAECGGAATVGRTERTMQVGADTRSFVVYVPAGYDGADGADLVVNLHGSGSDATEQLEGSQLERVADEHGFVVVAPDAGVATGDDSGSPLTGAQWNVPGSVQTDGSTVAADAPDDLAFVEALVTELSDEFCVDRVFSTGTSGGGRMSAALACNSDLFDGVAPVAGLRLPEPCAPAHGVEIVAFHGTADQVNGYLGGGLPSWGDQSVPDAAAGWAALQECTSGPEREQISPSVVRDTWSGCRDDVSVSLYTVDGGGHTWPGGADAAELYPELAPVVGVTTQEIDAGQLMWEHFARGD